MRSTYASFISAERNEAVISVFSASAPATISSIARRAARQGTKGQLVERFDNTDEVSDSRFQRNALLLYRAVATD